MSKRNTPQRRHNILTLLNEQGEVSVDALAKHFETSEVTIRKDLAALESNGLLLRRYGGALPMPHELVAEPSQPVSPYKQAIARAAARWHDADTVRARTGFAPPADGLHYRWPDLPSLAIEQRLHAKLDAVRAFARVNPVDRMVIESAQATVGIVTGIFAKEAVVGTLNSLYAGAGGGEEEESE